MVKMMKPDTLAKAFEVASLQESTIMAIDKFQKPKSFVPTPNRWSSHPIRPPDEVKPAESGLKTNRTTDNYRTITPTDL